MVLRTQGIHPFNPEGFDSATWDVTFNTTSSFISNTNWQGYAGETTMSYLTQMAGLAWGQLRVGRLRSRCGSGAGARLDSTGQPRAHTSATSGAISWRTTVYVLLPMSLVAALVLVSRGVIQNFSS